MRIRDRDGEFPGRKQVGDQYVAVAKRRLLLAKFAHKIATLLATPRGQHAEVPIIGTRIERNLAVTPLGIEQIVPAGWNFRRPDALAVVRDRVVVVVDVRPAILFVFEFVRGRRPTRKTISSPTSPAFAAREDRTLSLTRRRKENARRGSRSRCGSVAARCRRGRSSRRRTDAAAIQFDQLSRIFRLHRCIKNQIYPFFCAVDRQILACCEQ